MEQASTSYLFFLFVALLLPLLLLKQLKKQQRGVDEEKIRLPPGPWRLPVIGSLHHLIGKPRAHHAMADLARRLGSPPLMYLKLGEVRLVVATSRNAAREVLRTHDAALASRPWTPTIRAIMDGGPGLVFAPYGDTWRQLRRISVLELLSARRVRSFRRVREDETSSLVAGIAAGAAAQPVNVSERIRVLVADAAVRAMIGDRFERRDEFLALLEEGVRLVSQSGFSLADLFPSSRFAGLLSGTTRLARANRKKTLELPESAIKQHEERKKAAAAVNGAVEEEDILDVLLRVQKEGGLGDPPLTMATIKALIMDLYGAGSETSATALQWAMAELMRNPAVMKRAQDELRDNLRGKPKVTEDDLAQIKYLKLIIKETLRLHPPTPFLLPKEAMESCKILGYDVPKGTMVLVNVWAIARDPRYWEDPEEFKPERFEAGTIDFKGTNFEYIPFGAGRRMCPGVAFAESTMEIVLAVLLYHFDWELTDGLKPSELDMAEMGLSVRRKEDLHLHPIVRVPLQS
ncbi:hypothetical protein PR202_gb06442 [Eleusine coracana subsp. coracana]|uniref:Premnaspirodiene oxygenase n=1 Tax=Eleusine coracana subsp. coracana TaxID=191504 RepID=A0AAV5EAB0_ELECO|nr:hypothetical protein QOZ80_2BG0157440 [Eleusine coracana subsp. coracana]GJN19195.1 hypothetical protein PR202_gb06442 [Eleusine coracana subsp. coracana]